MDDVHNIVAHTRIFLSPFFSLLSARFTTHCRFFYDKDGSNFFIYTPLSIFFIVMFKVNRDRFMLYNLFEIRFHWHSHTASLYCSFDGWNSLTFNLRLFKEEREREKEKKITMKKKPQGHNGCHTKYFKDFYDKYKSLKELKIFVANSVRFNKSTSFFS